VIVPIMTGIEIRFGGSAGAIEVKISNGNLDYFIGDALPGLLRDGRPALRESLTAPR